MIKKNDKRQRLVGAAARLFHEQGINVTTLANIAALAEVPLGNVYYYFKSKESIISAVIEFHRKNLDEMLSKIDETSLSPKDKLKELVRVVFEDRDHVSKYGDIVGSLALELSRLNSDNTQNATSLINKIKTWISNQISAVTPSNTHVENTSINMIASIQGIASIGVAFQNKELVEQQINWLNSWIDSIN